MSRSAEIENYVLEGRVLDEQGNWIPIADKKTAEEAFVAHLSAGQVLHEGRWMPITEAKAARAASPAGYEDAAGAAPGLNLTDINGVPIEFPPETTSLATDIAVEGEPSDAFAPETKNMPAVPSASPEGNPSTTDPDSDYAQETGLFIVERSDAALNPQSSGTGGRPGLRLSSPPSTPSWVEGSKRRKGRSLLIGGGVVAALIGIGAVAAMVFQVFR